MAFGGSETITTPTPSDELLRLEKLNADIAELQKENILLQQQFQQNLQATGNAATPEQQALIQQSRDAALAVGTSDIEAFEKERLTSLREELAPSLGFRSSDTPILDRGADVATESVRQQGQLVSGLAGFQAQSLLQFPLDSNALIGSLGLGLAGIGPTAFGTAGSTSTTEQGLTLEETLGLISAGGSLLDELGSEDPFGLQSLFSGVSAAPEVAEFTGGLFGGSTAATASLGVGAPGGAFVGGPTGLGLQAFGGPGGGIGVGAGSTGAFTGFGGIAAGPGAGGGVAGVGGAAGGAGGAGASIGAVAGPLIAVAVIAMVINGIETNKAEESAGRQVFQQIVADGQLSLSPAGIEGVRFTDPVTGKTAWMSPDSFTDQNGDAGAQGFVLSDAGDGLPGLWHPVTGVIDQATIQKGVVDNAVQNAATSPGGLTASNRTVIAEDAGVPEAAIRQDGSIDQQMADAWVTLGITEDQTRLTNEQLAEAQRIGGDALVTKLNKALGGTAASERGN